MYANIDDLPECVDDSVQFANAPRAAKTQRPIRYAQTKTLLWLYAILSVLLGLAVSGASVALFVILPSFSKRQSFQIENKWTMLSVLLSGICLFGFLGCQRLVFVCASLCFSAVSIVMSIVTFIVHAVNVYFRHKDAAVYEEIKDYRSEQASRAAANTNLALSILSLGCGIVSCLAYFFMQKLTILNYGYSLGMDKHRLRLAMMGLAQIVFGLLIASWWIGVEIFFSSENLNHYALPTGEILCHGLIFPCAGALQMLATSRGSVPFILAAATLNGASAILSTYFAAYPLSVLYFVLDQKQGMAAAVMTEAKVALCALLCLLYIAEILFSVYSFLKLLKVVRLPMSKHMLMARQRMLHIFSLIFCVTGFVYALLEIIAVCLQFMYKLDFTSLPVMIVACGALILYGIRFGTPLVQSAAIAMLGYCGTFSLQEIYLFIYHATALTPDAPDADAESTTFSTTTRMQDTATLPIPRSNRSKLRGSNLAVHFIQTLIALGILILCVVAILMLARMLQASTSIMYNSLKCKMTIRLQLWSSTLQLLCGFVVMCCSFKLFVNQELYLEDFGDRAATLGFLMIFAGALGVSSKKYSILSLASFMAEILVFTLIWQESDRLIFLVRSYAGKQNQFESQKVTSAPFAATQYSYKPSWEFGALALNAAFGLASVVLFFLLIGCIISMIYTISAGLFYDRCHFVATTILPGADTDAVTNGTVGIDEPLTNPPMDVEPAVEIDVPLQSNANDLDLRLELKTEMTNGNTPQ